MPLLMLIAQSRLATKSHWEIENDTGLFKSALFSGLYLPATVLVTDIAICDFNPSSERR